MEMIENNDAKIICSYKKIPLKYSFGLQNKLTTINSKFLLIADRLKSPNEIISIYDLESLSLLDTIEHPQIFFLEFHKHFDTIFFVATEKNIVLYEIDLTNKKPKTLSTIKGHFTNVIFADFSPYNPNILFSVSQNNDIKIYDLSKNMPISHIFINESFCERLKIKWGKIFMGFISNGKIIIFNYLLFLKENILEIQFQEEIVDFYFCEDVDFPLIALTEKELIYVLEKDNKKSIYTFDKEFESNYFLKEEKILIIFFDDIITGLTLNFSKVNTIFSLDINKCKVSYPIFIIDELLLKEDEICKFYSKNNKIIKFFTITLKKRTNNNNDNSNNNDNNNKAEVKITEFLKNIIDKISDIPLLLSNKNNIEMKYLIGKKYFDYKELEGELNEIKKRNLLKRKKEVLTKISDIDEKEDLIERYIFILKLLVNDNTNTVLVKKYLNFLSDNKKLLDLHFKNNYEEYGNELIYYLKILSPIEALEFKQNKKSQKEELINFMENLLKIRNNFEKIEKYFDSLKDFQNNIIRYNMPCDKNNEELYYYGFLNLLKYNLKNIWENIKEELKNTKTDNEQSLDDNKKDILENELRFLFDKMSKTKDYINKNPSNLEKIEYLILLLVETSNEEEYNFGYNLITSEKLAEDKIAELKKDDKFTKNYKIKNEQNYENICLNNISLNIQNLIYSKKIYNYEYYKAKYEEKYELSLVKQFYKNILQKKCFKSIYSTLYGENEYYPFENQDYTNYFIDNYYNFIPMRNDNLNGMTTKFSMKIFIVSFLPKVSGKCTKKEQKLLRQGLIISTSNHEIGHDFVNDHFYMENAKISVEKPIKQYLDIIESGDYIEFCLYGRILQTIDKKQALYILNEKNYEKTFLEFEEGFNNMKKEDIMIEGTFKEMFKDFNLDELELERNKNIYIVSKPNKLHEKVIACNLKNDVIGRKFSDKFYNEIYKKYT